MSVNSNQKLEELLKEREDLKDVLEILEGQLYKFEGELLSTAFYGTILNGWNRSAMSIIPSKATPEMLCQKVNDEDRIISRSSVEFMKRMRREAQDQEKRARSFGKLSRQDTSADNTQSELKRKRTVPPPVSSPGRNSSIGTKKNRSN